jgi:hypothetical protein
VCVCEPQAVSTDLMYRGALLSLTSKILMPSQYALLPSLWDVEEQESSQRRESVDRKTRFPMIEMSFCEPGHSTWLTIFVFFGFLMS